MTRGELKERGGPEFILETVYNDISLYLAKHPELTPAILNMEDLKIQVFEDRIPLEKMNDPDNLIAFQGTLEI